MVKIRQKLKLISIVVALVLFMTSITFLGPANRASASTTFQQRANILLNYFNQNSPLEAPLINGVDNRYKNFSKYHSWIAEASFALGNITRGRSLATEALTKASDMFHFYAAMDCYMRFKGQYTQTMKDLAKTKIGGRSSDLYDNGTTENHHLMNSVARYLAGQEWPDKASYVGASKGEAWLNEFLDRVVKQGFLEQDSDTYMAMYTSPILVLADHATNATMKQKAKMAYEWLMAQWAPEWMDGYHVSSSYRMRTPEFEPSIPKESLTVGWLFFGGQQPASFMQALQSPDNEWYPLGCWAIPSAISSLRVPTIISNIAEARSTAFVHKEVCDVGGYNPTGFHRYTYMNGNYGVTSTYNGYNDFFREQIHEGQVKWISANNNGTFFINQPRADQGGTQLKVEGAEPQFQTLQYNGTQVSVNIINSNDSIKYIRGCISKTAYVSKKEEPSTGWIFMDCGPLYLASKIVQGGFTVFEDVDGKFRWFKNTNTKNGVIIETAPKSAYASLTAFETAVKACPIDASGINNTNPVLKYTNLEGKQMEITYGGTRKVNGVAYNYSTWPLINNPWMNQARGGQYLTINYGGVTRTYDFNNWTINETGSPTPTPTPTPSSLFNDNFEDGNAVDWTVLGGTWSVVTDGSYVYNQSATSGTTSSINGETAWNNYNVSAKMKIVTAGSSGVSLDLMGRYVDGNNFYYLRLNKSSNTIMLLKKVGGTISTLKSVAFTVNTSQWYDLKLEFTGTTIKGYVDGVEKINMTDSSLSSGKVGIRTNAAAARFDDILVQ